MCTSTGVFVCSGTYLSERVVYFMPVCGWFSFDRFCCAVCMPVCACVSFDRFCCSVWGGAFGTQTASSSSLASAFFTSSTKDFFTDLLV